MESWLKDYSTVLGVFFFFFYSNNELFVYLVYIMGHYWYHILTQTESHIQIGVSHFIKVPATHLFYLPSKQRIQLTTLLFIFFLKKSLNVTYLFESIPMLLPLVTITASHTPVVNESKRYLLKDVFILI